MKTSHILLTVTLLFCSVDNSTFGQTSGFKVYADKKNHFSFDIPSQWNITDDTTYSDIISTCRPSSTDSSYDECFDGIVFYIELYNTDLSKTLEGIGLYKKYGTVYYTVDRVSDSVKTENIRGINWTGIYHNNTCGISCKELGFHAAAGNCEFYYFSNREKTICITTTGRSLDEDIKTKLLKTFKFN